MKKIIGIIFISLMFANIGFAEIKLIEQAAATDGRNHPTNVWHDHIISTICVDGYKFVMERSGSDESPAISMVQFYEVGGTSPNRHMALPAKC